MANEQRVVELVIDASGVEAGARRAELAYEHLGDRAAAATAKAQAAFDRQVQIFERKVPQSIDAVASAYDRVRASVDPVIAVQIKAERQMTQSLQTVNRAVLLGVTTQEQANADIARLRAQQVVQIDEVREAQERLNQSHKQGMVAANQNVRRDNGFQTANVAAQFQDVAVTAAMGMSPLQIALQQGTQLSAVLGPMGAAGAVKGLGAAFLSVISPVSLVTIGLVAGTAALIQYFATADSGGEKTSKLFEEQNNLIRQAAKLWGDATPSLKTYVDELDRAKNLQDGSAAVDVLASRQFDGLSEKIEVINRQFIDARRNLQQLGADPAFIRDFSSAFGDLRQKLADGTATLADVNAAQQQLAIGVAQYGTPQVLKFRDAFDVVTESIYRGIEAARKVREEWIAAIAGGVDVQTIVSGATFTEGGKTYQPDAFRPINAPTPVRRPTQELGGDPGPTTILNSDGHLTVVPTPGEKPIQLGDEPSKAATQTANAYRDLVKSANDRIEQMKLEGQVSGLTGIAAQTLRLELDLLQKAQEKGRIATPEQRAEIKALADAYRNAAQEAAKLKLASELQFERDQMYRSTVDQQIAQSQRSAGLEVDLKSGYADAVRELDRVRELRKDVGGFFSDFRDGLLQGDSFGQAFGNALLNVLNKVTTRLTDSLINDLVNAITGKSSGGGLLSTLTGGAANDNNVAATAASAVGAAPVIGVTRSALPAVAGTGDQLAWNFWKSKGLADHQVAGVLGNISAESAFNPAAIGDGGKARGLFQWNDRSPQMLAAVGANWKSNPLAQHEFAYRELMGPESRAWSALTGAKDVRGATAAFAGFERPRGFSWNNPEGADNFSGRLEAAEASLTKFSGASSSAAGSMNGMVSATGEASSGLGALGKGFGNFGQQLSGLQGGGASSLVGGFNWSSLFSSSFTPNTTLLGFLTNGFDGGGWTGPGARNKPAGIVHADEIVWSQDDIRRHGGVAVVEAKRLGYPGYADGGIVGRRSPSIPPARVAANDGGSARSGSGDGGDKAVRMDIHVHGARGNAEIEDMVDRGVSRAIDQYDRQVLPVSVRRIEKNPRKRA
ncbi:phage tail tip lysozyme [Pararhizobium sp. LjRoot238]|uniref:phage tail tip lysozyme n=1 Tax=Pararhizobium sp. LjRoot238 TaxID=3342293 RepID=UPI003ED00B3D